MAACRFADGDRFRPHAHSDDALAKQGGMTNVRAALKCAARVSRPVYSAACSRVPPICRTRGITSAAKRRISASNG
jgi:hypothetical protein